MEKLKQRIDDIRSAIFKASQVAGTDFNDIDIVAVTKTVTPDIIQEAVANGIVILGENRVQEALKKIPRICGDVKWHLIGHLQRNKVKPAVQKFSMIQSLDSFELATAIDRAAQNQGSIVDVLVQINIGMEDSKYGIKPQETLDFVTRVSSLTNIRIKGLMTIPPYKENPEEVRPFFRDMREIFEDIKGRDIENVEMKHLSMGMTQDFLVAVEEGSNMVRIGTGIFGARK
jgi:pyridoxal phosphate enzyme (YggS family)